jgi:hypothetical protein
MYGFDNYFFFFVINFQGNYKKKHFCFVCHALYRYVLFSAYRMIDFKIKKKQQLYNICFYDKFRTTNSSLRSSASNLFDNDTGQTSSLPTRAK